MTAIATAPPNVRHSSASNEHYSPPKIIEAARAVLGEIDLDPATSAIGNTVVKAATTFHVGGLERPWLGRVFVNPPGGRTEVDGKPVSSQKAWWFKLAREWQSGRVSAAIFVSFSIELLQTSQVKPPSGLMLPLDFPICFPSRRLAYWREAPNDADTVLAHGEPMTKLVESSSPPHSSMLVYLPPFWCETNSADIATGVKRFRAHFGAFGAVNIPLDRKYLRGPAMSLALDTSENGVTTAGEVGGVGGVGG